MERKKRITMQEMEEMELLGLVWNDTLVIGFSVIGCNYTICPVWLDR